MPVAFAAIDLECLQFNFTVFDLVLTDSVVFPKLKLGLAMNYLKVFVLPGIWDMENEYEYILMVTYKQQISSTSCMMMHLFLFPLWPFTGAGQMMTLVRASCSKC